jgi:Leucine-rich repeat (LRR) protein
MKKLKQLDLQRSGLEDVSWLKDMNQLLMLDIRFNPRVHDIKSLSGTV